VQAVGALGLEFRLLIAVEVVVLHSEGVDYRRAGSVTGCAIQHVSVELLSWLVCLVFWSVSGFSTPCRGQSLSVLCLFSSDTMRGGE
jgi:hypothetical protein